MGQFPNPLHPFHPSHPSFVLLPFLGLLLSLLVCLGLASVLFGFGGWRVRPVITWSPMVSRKPIPAASFIFETTLKHMEAWIGDRKLFWQYVKKYCFDVCVSFYHRKLLLTKRLILLLEKQTLHITYLPVLALFISKTTIWRRSWLLERRCYFSLAFRILHFIVLQQLYSNILGNVSLTLLHLTCNEPFTNY